MATKRKCPPCPCAKKRKTTRARPAKTARKSPPARKAAKRRGVASSNCSLRVIKIGPQGGSKRVGRTYATLHEAETAAKKLSKTNRNGTRVRGSCGDRSNPFNTMYLAYENGRRVKR